MHEIRSKPKKFFSLSFFVALITFLAICFTPASAGYRPTAGAVTGMAMYYGNLAPGIQYHRMLLSPELWIAAGWLHQHHQSGRFLFSRRC